MTISMPLVALVQTSNVVVTLHDVKPAPVCSFAHHWPGTLEHKPRARYALKQAGSGLREGQDRVRAITKQSLTGNGADHATTASTSDPLIPDWTFQACQTMSSTVSVTCSAASR